jgi:hypothetical protein
LIPAVFGLLPVGSTWIFVRGILTGEIGFDNSRMLFGKNASPAAYWLLVMFWAVFTTIAWVAFGFYAYAGFTGQF